jgi:uncharacterized protein (DUF2384 family)
MMFLILRGFQKWLMTPARTLGNKIPFELLDGSLGFEIVK